jgi:type I restriction enzyme S subunit
VFSDLELKTTHIKEGIDTAFYITFIGQNGEIDHITVIAGRNTLMDKYGDAGAVRYGISGAFNVALGKICVKDGNYREYVRSYLESKPIYTYLHNSCMASTRASLSEANLSMLYIAIPDQHTIVEYEKMLHAIRSSILKNNDETEKLIELRDWLLPMLMNGQATISD